MNEILEEFINKWGNLDNQKFPEDGDFLEVEETLKIKLPAEYVHLVKTYGDVWCPSLLDEIVDSNTCISDVQNFLLPTEMIETTESWQSAGMPKGYIAFASDCMGNVFCFKLSELSGNDNPSIWFFDHDFCEISKVSNSFIIWLKRFINVGNNKILNLLKSMYTNYKYS